MFTLSTYKVRGKDIPVTTSRKVAEVFGKRHADVIRDIEKLTERNSALSVMFTLHPYKDRTGRTLKQYLLTHDGFTLLVMGFTGAEALEFKLAYINAFNDMREAIEDHKLNREIAREGSVG